MKQWAAPVLLMALAFNPASADSPSAFLLEYCEPVANSVALFPAALPVLFAKRDQPQLRPFRQDNIEVRLFALRPGKVSHSADFQVRRVRIPKPTRSANELHRLHNSIFYAIRSQMTRDVNHLKLINCYFDGSPQIDEPIDIYLVTEPFTGYIEPQTFSARADFSIKASRKKELWERILMYLRLAREVQAVHRSGFASYEISLQRIVFPERRVMSVMMNCFWNLQRIGERVTSFSPDLSDAETNFQSIVSPLNDIYALGMLMAEFELTHSVLVGDRRSRAALDSGSKQINLARINWKNFGSLIKRGESEAEDFEGRPGGFSKDSQLARRMAVRIFWYNNTSADAVLRLFINSPNYDFKQLVLRMIHPDRNERLQNMDTVVQWLRLLANHKRATEEDWKTFGRDFLNPKTHAHQ